MAETGVADTSRETFQKVKARGIVEQTRNAILRHLATYGPDHDTHGAQATGIWLNTYAPTRTGLKKDGLVHNTGKRATNVRGNTCIIWELTDEGRKAANR